MPFPTPGPLPPKATDALNPRTYLVGCAMTGILASDRMGMLSPGDVAKAALAHADAVMDVMGCCKYKDRANRRCLRSKCQDSDFCEYHLEGEPTP